MVLITAVTMIGPLLVDIARDLNVSARAQADDRDGPQALFSRRSRDASA